MKYVYEVFVADKEGSVIDSIYFSSHNAASKFKPRTGHITCIVQWRVFTEKDIVE